MLPIRKQIEIELKKIIPQNIFNEWMLIKNEHLNMEPIRALNEGKYQLLWQMLWDMNKSER